MPLADAVHTRGGRLNVVIALQVRGDPNRVQIIGPPQVQDLLDDLVGSFLYSGACGWLRVLLDGCGCFWMVVGACGWLRVLADGCGCLRMVAGACGWLWMLVDGCGCFWLLVGACGCLRMVVGACGWLRVLVDGCGCFWLLVGVAFETGEPGFAQLTLSVSSEIAGRSRDSKAVASHPNVASRLRALKDSLLASTFSLIFGHPDPLRHPLPSS